MYQYIKSSDEIKDIEFDKLISFDSGKRFTSVALKFLYVDGREEVITYAFSGLRNHLQIGVDIIDKGSYNP